MTDAHFHRGGYATFLSDGGTELKFFGVHPWQADAAENPEAAIASIRAELVADQTAGVGECGLDRLHTKTVSGRQREVFARQLLLAAELGRPTVLHGAKCWGETVAACRPFSGRIPAFLFHGFSRSAGLLPDIAALGGFVSVGPALLNDHAVNYRELAATLPDGMLLVETDMQDDDPDSDRLAILKSVIETLAKLRGVSGSALEVLTDANAARFARAIR